MLKITLEQARKINRLIRRECCNYDKGFCRFLTMESGADVFS